jgi:4,5-DOPA dioxygenase extradiol
MTDQAYPGKKARMIYFSHGGGPLPILGDPGHKAMIDFMTALPNRIPRPEAIVVVSAHWEESKATLLGAPHPPMFYDYYGFPDEAYQIQYPAPGSPALASKIAGLIRHTGTEAAIDTQRGFDHGLFIPLKMMYPQADIPCLGLSLLLGLDPADHLALGKALRGLLDENILVIGSGFSFHNLRAFMRPGAGGPDPANDAFQDWLIQTITGPFSEAERENRLIAWEQAPNARYCHPRADHLLPLHVCQGMAGTPGKLIFDDQILGVRSLGFLW